jgi:signal transduction histidine kinase/ActR/RegA family two-component response regulator
MPRTSRISSGVRQPASIRFGMRGSSHRLASIQRISAGKALAGVLNSALDGVALLHAIRNGTDRIVDFRWTRINPEGEKILNRKADALIGGNLLAMFPGAAHSGLVDRWASVVDGGKPLRHEQEYTHDGMRGWIEWSVAGIADGVAVTFRDVSARHRDNAALQAALAEARKAEQAKATFLTLVSHELRTPLNGVVGALDLLSGYPIQDQSLFLDTARTSARELNRVVAAILDFTSLDAGPAKPNPMPFDLHELINQEAESIAPIAATKHLRVECRIDRNAPRRLIGSPGHIRQILRALLENAVKFTQAGSVELALTSCTDHADPEENTRSGGATACFSLSVSDTGIGIDPEFHTSLFQAFFQRDSSLHRPHDGCGLGLAISSRLADQLGGTLTVQSQPGQGSTFRLDLALPIADHPGDTWPSDLETSLKKRILLADPGEASGMVTAMMLARAGFEVETVTGGLEALRVAKLRRFDAMVMDMALPDMNGVMTVKALRRLPGPNGSVPIVAITEARDVYDEQHSLAAGVTDLMVKPFRKNNLLEKLGRFFQSNSASISA